MPDSNAVADVGLSIERLLSRCFGRSQPVRDEITTVVLVRTEDLDESNLGRGFPIPALTVLPYKIDVDRTMRAAWAGVGHQEGRSYLPLDIHFLMTPWAGSASNELRILGRTLQCLDMTPSLSGPLLQELRDLQAPEELSAWAPTDAIQLCIEDLTTEDVMRTFDSLPIDFKLSVCYVARVVRIDGAPRPDPATMRVDVGPPPAGAR